MKCPYCDKEAKWVDNAEIYGRRYGKSYMMWLCKPCDAYVGCHNNTEQPLGTMANRDIREARKKAHAVIDPLWKTGKYSRKSVYARLSDAFGEAVHVAESDEKQCDEIIKTAGLVFNI